MGFKVEVGKLPRDVLETAVRLNDPLKKVYITLYCQKQPTAPKEIAKTLGYARAYVHMRLCQLESMGLAKRVEDEKRVKFSAL